MARHPSCFSRKQLSGGSAIVFGRLGSFYSWNETCKVRNGGVTMSKIEHMFILDTDHASELGFSSPAGLRLLSRFDQTEADIVITAIC